jgi:acyl carrier protein
MDRKSALIEYIKNDIMRNSKANLAEDEDLLGSGILDSLAILQLVGFIDETFSIEVPDQDVIYENFNSIKALDDYLKQY